MAQEQRMTQTISTVTTALQFMGLTKQVADLEATSVTVSVITIHCSGMSNH